LISSLYHITAPVVKEKAAMCRAEAETLLFFLVLTSLQPTPLHPELCFLPERAVMRESVFYWKGRGGFDIRE
jgi:hypothetical protein